MTAIYKHGTLKSLGSKTVLFLVAALFALPTQAQEPPDVGQMNAEKENIATLSRSELTTTFNLTKADLDRWFEKQAEGRGHSE